MAAERFHPIRLSQITPSFIHAASESFVWYWSASRHPSAQAFEPQHGKTSFR
jgi:hypothetical protein